MKFRVPPFAQRGLLGRIGVRSNLAPQGYRTAVVAVLLFAVFLGSGAKLVSYNINALPPDAVFQTSHDTMTKQQLQQRVKLMEFVYGLQPPKEPAKLDGFNRSVAKAMAVSDIVDDAARSQGIVIPDKAASDQLNNMIKQNGIPDRATFIQQLGARGISEQNLLDEIKRQQSNARLFGNVTKSVPPTSDGDAQRYFDEHRKDMVSPEQRDIMNIVVRSPEEAQQVAQQAGSGSDFGELAKQMSIDGSTKDHGGSLGLVQADQLDPAYAKAAFAAPPHSIFGPVQTSQGWNVGKVNDVQPSKPMPFDQLKDPIKTKLDNDAKIRRWNEFLSQRIKDAEVVYAPEYQPQNPDASPGEATTNN